MRGWGNNIIQDGPGITKKCSSLKHLELYHTSRYSGLPLKVLGEMVANVSATLTTLKPCFLDQPDFRESSEELLLVNTG